MYHGDHTKIQWRLMPAPFLGKNLNIYVFTLVRVTGQTISKIKKETASGIIMLPWWDAQF